MKYELDGREVDGESFEYGICDEGFPVLEYACFKDEGDPLDMSERFELVGIYGMPSEAYEIIENTNEAWTLKERNQ